MIESIQERMYAYAIEWSKTHKYPQKEAENRMYICLSQKRDFEDENIEKIIIKEWEEYVHSGNLSNICVPVGIQLSELIFGGLKFFFMLVKLCAEAVFDHTTQCLVPTKPSALTRPIYWYTYRGIRGAFCLF